MDPWTLVAMLTALVGASASRKLSRYHPRYVVSEILFLILVLLTATGLIVQILSH